MGKIPLAQASRQRFALRPVVARTPEKLFVTGTIKRASYNDATLYNSGGAGPDVSYEAAFSPERLTWRNRDSLLPLTRIGLNDWLFKCYLEAPVLKSAIDLNAAMASSAFEFTCPDDQAIARDCNDFKDNFELETLFRSNNLDRQIYGESITAKFWDEDAKDWDMIVERVPQCFDVIEQEIHGSKPAWPGFPRTELIYFYLDEIHQSFQNRFGSLAGRKRGVIYTNSAARATYGMDDIPLPAFNICHYYDRNVTGVRRGISSLRTALFYWIMEQALMMAQYRVIDDRLKYPDLWKFSYRNIPDMRPLQPAKRFLDFDEALQRSEGQPVDYIITYDDVSLDTASSGIRLLPIAAEVEFLQNMQATALWSEVGTQSGNRAFPTWGQEYTFQQYREYRFRGLRDDLYQKHCINDYILPRCVARNYFKRKTADLSHNVRTSRGNTLIQPQVVYTGDDDAKVRELFDSFKDTCASGDVLDIDSILADPSSGLGLSTATRLRYAAKQDYIVPTINLTDHIRLQDLNMELDHIKSLAGRGLPEYAAAAYVCDRLGISLDELSALSLKYSRSLYNPGVINQMQENIQGFLTSLKEQQESSMYVLGNTEEPSEEVPTAPLLTPSAPMSPVPEGGFAEPNFPSAPAGMGLEAPETELAPMEEGV